MSNVRIAPRNNRRQRCSRHSSPSKTTCTVLSVPGGKPRRVACSRAQFRAARRVPKVPYTFLLQGPCNRPSAPRRKVYITTSVALRPFLLLSPFLRLGLDHAASAASGSDAADNHSHSLAGGGSGGHA